MYRLTFFVFVASVAASPPAATCPEVKPVENFNLTSYGQGIWYEVARYPNAGVDVGECGSAEYKLEGDEIKVKNVHVVNKKAVSIEGVAKLAPDAGKTGKVAHSLHHGAGDELSDSILNILAIDYDKYLIAYHCKYDESSQKQQEFAWILSRSKSLSAETKTAVDNLLKECKVLSAEKFEWPKFTEEACKVEA